MEREELQDLWESTLGDLEGKDLDPSMTYRSPAWERLHEQSAGNLGMGGDRSAGGLLKKGRTHRILDEDDFDKTMMDWRPVGEDEEEDAYVLLEQLARGGMGLVYRARQSALKREIAIKKAHPQPGIQERFLSEALVSANLNHPNIVPVYDIVALEQGLSLAMQLVGGLSWKALLHPVTPEDQEHARKCDLEFHIEVLLQVCNAVAYAHSKGFTHNDLKPENIMVGEFGEIYVMDWGLALDVRPNPTAPYLAPHCSTIKGEVFGTPCYMAPELAEGFGAQIGPWTDVFLLGGILYEIIMGHAPHRGLTMMEVLLKASLSEPLTFAPDIPKSLQRICSRAMAKEISQRYQNVTEFRDALRTFLKHRESMLITEKAQFALRQCTESMGLQLAAYDQTQSRTRVLHTLRKDRNQLYIDFAEAVSGFCQAQVLWSENEEARIGELQARLAFASAALKHGDLGLAESQASSLGSNQPEAIALFAEIEAASQQRTQQKRNARLQSRILFGGGILLVLGLLVGISLLTTERNRAHRSAALAQQNLSLIHRLADARELSDYKTQAEFLWPALPDKIKQIERWLAKAGALLSRKATHKAALDVLRKQGTPLGGKWHFKQRTLQWQHDTLANLLQQMEDFQQYTLQSVIQRLEIAKSLAQREFEHQALWKDAIAKIADAKQSPVYAGLQLPPQPGLLPIGRDPQSGLWEFVHLLSGTAPTRDNSGKLQITEANGIVLVLLPAGTLQMGATKNPSDPNVDPLAQPNEGPVHAVALSAFFLSKFELTQAQWMRFSQRNPSAFLAGQHPNITPLHPVERVSWKRATLLLNRMGLQLPTEAQWEFAARAQTNTPWWTGARKYTLKDAANLADRSRQIYPASRTDRTSVTESWLKDGYSIHAPIGQFRPNPWGFHDILGNVSEWCLDRYGPYTLPTAPPQGLRLTKQQTPYIYRGGSFQTTASFARTTARPLPQILDFRAPDLGIRPARNIER